MIQYVGVVPHFVGTSEPLAIEVVVSIYDNKCAFIIPIEVSRNIER